MTINMGPHHPATHGVLRLVVQLEGEVVRDLKPIMGYVHTGIEKNCEEKAYWKVIPYVERMDYVSYFFQMQAFCGAVERLIEIEIPRRAQYLRVLLLELNRIHSHLVWLGTTALDLGAISMLWYCFRERDTDPRPLRDGDRPAHAHALLPGRRRHRGHPARFRGQGPRLLRRDARARRPVPGAARPQRDLPPAHQGRRPRVPRQRLLDLGVTGPLLRATGDPWDLRKAEPYLVYPELDFRIPVGTVGDGYDRFRVRLEEMKESIEHRPPVRRGAARGPVHRRRPQVRAAPALGALHLDGGADPPLQARHRGLSASAPARSTTRSRAPRGELGCFVVADGSARPARVHFRDPSFVNLQSLRDMCIDGYIADLIANLGMLDPILGGVDR